MRIKGRGAASNPDNRFFSTRVELEDDGWSPPEDTGGKPEPVTVTLEHARSILSKNDSPDVPFDLSINPYKGCQHGCIYCFARPTHAYLDLSPGLDFETKIFAKKNAAALLAKELGRRSYECRPINIGSNTDPYQPAEKRLQITRSILEVLETYGHPCTIITKNALVERDIDLLAQMAQRHLVQVFVSVTSLDNRLSSRLEPAATAPHRRIDTIAHLKSSGIPVGVLVAPIIPAVTDIYLEKIIQLASQAGATCAGYTVIRLPHELKGLFREWLANHLPERATHVMSLIQQMHGGRDYVADFRTRMRGEGVFACLIKERFEMACRRSGIEPARAIRLDTQHFKVPQEAGHQASLF